MTPFRAAQQILDDGAAALAFPAAVAEVGSAGAVRWRTAVGRLTYAPGAPPCTAEAVFDLASLTKVIATTSLWMRLVDTGRLREDARVHDWIPCWAAADRSAVRVTELLDHSAGLPAHARLFAHLSGRQAFMRAICETPLADPPGSRATYSDLGFMLLGFALEAVGGAPLDAQFAPIAEAIAAPLTFNPPESWRVHTAPTELDPRRGHVLCGEVHDENAAALGGVAGHAGLFGTAHAVGTFARAVLRTFQKQTWLGSPELMRRVARQSAVPESSRALGWDTMRPTSSCGHLMSSTAIGHTGFTGTSLWIDWERDLYVVLLTNRVHPTRENESLVKLRPLFHDAVMNAI